MQVSSIKSYKNKKYDIKMSANGMQVSKTKHKNTPIQQHC